MKLTEREVALFQDARAALIGAAAIIDKAFGSLKRELDTASTEWTGEEDRDGIGALASQVEELVCDIDYSFQDRGLRFFEIRQRWGIPETTSPGAGS